MTKTNFASRIAGVATLALAALPMAALSTAAHAAETVKVADLNLMTPEGATKLDGRIEKAAFKFCADRRAVSEWQTCRAGVRAELTEKAETLRQAQFAQAQKTFAAR
jgi:UrcA family protein